MDIIYSKELMVPLYQVGLLLVVSALGLLFARVKIALLLNFLLGLNWVYSLNRAAILGKETPSLDPFTLGYFGFGLVIIVLALIGFMSSGK